MTSRLTEVFLREEEGGEDDWEVDCEDVEDFIKSEVGDKSVFILSATLKNLKCFQQHDAYTMIKICYQISCGNILQLSLV